jgi:hypothetical protein
MVNWAERFGFMRLAGTAVKSLSPKLEVSKLGAIGNRLIAIPPVWPMTATTIAVLFNETCHLMSDKFLLNTRQYLFAFSQR